VSTTSLEQALPEGDRILLDTTALAAYLDATESTHGLATNLVDVFVASGRNPAVVSMITVMELLVRPLRATPRGHHTVLAFLRAQPNLTAVPVDIQVAQDAAFLRAAQRFSPPDALIVGTGFASQVGHLITNDKAWARKLKGLESRIRVCTLADYLPAEPTLPLIESDEDTLAEHVDENLAGFGEH
jgi:predicted nucleic acid-binding protein